MDKGSGPGAGAVDGPGTDDAVGIIVGGAIGSSGATLSRLLERGIIDYIKLGGCHLSAGGFGWQLPWH